MSWNRIRGDVSSHGTFEKRIVRRVEFLLWAVFVHTMAIGVLAPRTSTDTPTLLYRTVNLAGWVWPVLLLGLVAAHWRPLAVRAKARGLPLGLVYALLSACVVAIPIGLLLGAHNLADIVGYTFVPYAAVVLTLLGGALPELRERLVNTLSLQVFPAALFGAFALVFRPIVSREDFISIHYSAYSLLMPIAFLLPIMDCYGLLRRVGVLCALAVMVLLNVFGQNRLALFEYGLLVPLLTILWVLVRRRTRQTLRAVALFSPVVLIGLASFGAGRWKSEIALAWAQSEQRLFSSDDITSYGDATTGLQNSVDQEYSNARGAEAVDFIQSADWYVWLVGRGFGTTWYSQFWRLDWSMVHFGPLNLVLRGGIPFMLTFMGILTLALFRGLRWSRRNPFAVGASTYLLMWYLGFFSHGPFGANYSTYIMWILAGGLLATKGPAPLKRGQRVGHSQRRYAQHFMIPGTAAVTVSDVGSR